MFTSDHGEMMGSHSLYAKGVLYEEAVRVRMLLLQSRKIGVGQPVSHIDLVPTLMGNTREDLPEESLLAYVKRGKRREDHVFIEGHAPPNGPNVEMRNRYYRNEAAPASSVFARRSGSGSAG